MNFVEIFDGDERIDLFRIIGEDLERSDGATRVYNCEHVLAPDLLSVKVHADGGLALELKTPERKAPSVRLVFLYPLEYRLTVIERHADDPEKLAVYARPVRLLFRSRGGSLRLFSRRLLGAGFLSLLRLPLELAFLYEAVDKDADTDGVKNHE